MSRRLVALLVVAMAALLVGTIACLRVADQTYRDYSALKTTERFLIYHLNNTSELQFPDSWDELAADYDHFVEDRKPVFTLDKLEQQITINWRHGAKFFARETAWPPSGGPPIISLRNGEGGRFHGDDPNDNLVKFLLELRTSRGRK